MKKILFLSLIIALFTACSNEDIVTSTLPVEEGNACELTFNVVIPEATSASRALGEPTISSIRSLNLLVFDENGLYIANQSATEVTPVSATAGTYKVSLNATGYKRIIHVVANYDKEISYQPTANAVLAQLDVYNGEDAYWQKIELNDGISENMDFPTVELVRNFARIQLAVSAGAKFTLDGFVVVNQAKGGTVAPYKTSAEGGFASFTGSTLYDNLIQEGYAGVQPVKVEIDKTIPGQSSEQYNNKEPKYLYERTQLGDNDPACIIIKGSYNGAPSTFYKVDIINKKGNVDEYYKLFRNFSYDLTINSVAGNGFATPAEAMEHAASNNLSASVELQNLLNISDGIDRLFVSVIDTTIVNEKPFEIKYKFLENGNAANSKVEFYNFENGNVINRYECNKASMDSKGFTTITIHPNTPEAGKKEQIITISGGKLSRSITLNLRKPYEFANVGCTKPGAGTGQPLTVTFTLPDLPESLFPLTFVVEAVNHTIYPDTEYGISMPVVLLENGSFGYERTVTYEEYQKSKVINCPFKTNTANYDSDINITNKYFIAGSTSIGSIKGFTDFIINNEVPVIYGEDRDVVVTFSMTNKETVNISASKMKSARSTGGTCTGSNGTFTYTPANSGVQTITFTTGEFVSAGSVTLSATDYADATKSYTNRLYVNRSNLKGSLDLSNVNMYLDDSYSNSIGTYNFTGTGNALSADINVRNAAFTENSILYFRQYANANNMCYAQISIAELLDGNVHTLVFRDKDGNEIREFASFTINNGARALCGKEVEVPVTFTMPSVAPVTITVAHMSNTPSSDTGTINSIGNNVFIYTPKIVGEQKITFITSDVVSAGNVTLEAVGYISVTETIRNRLFVSRDKLKSNISISSYSSNNNAAIYTSTNYSRSRLGDVYYKFTGSSSDYRLNENIDIDIDVTLGERLYFRSGGSLQRRYADISIEELLNGEIHTLNFTTNRP